MANSRIHIIKWVHCYVHIASEYLRTLAACSCSHIFQIKSIITLKNKNKSDALNCSGLFAFQDLQMQQEPFWF